MQNSAIWDPYHYTDKCNLEMIQLYVARFALNKPCHSQQQNDSITDMLTCLSIIVTHGQYISQCVIQLIRANLKLCT